MDLNRLTEREQTELELLLKAATESTVTINFEWRNGHRLPFSYQVPKMHASDPDVINVRVGRVGS